MRVPNPQRAFRGLVTTLLCGVLYYGFFHWTTTHAPWVPAVQHALVPSHRAHADCDRCTVAPEWCREFGSRNLDLALAYEGSGDRVRRVMARAQAGQPLHFGIIGGSLSRGHACKCTVFHRQIFDWWNATFPHAGNEYVDGSVGARGSSYFKFCDVEHIRQNADFVIIELGINDLLSDDHMRNIESILRTVLSFPSKPAIVMTASFSLMGKMTMGADGHLPVAQYYDVPVISIRNALLPILQRYPEKVKDYFIYFDPVFPDRTDLLHLSGLGHRVLAETTISFLKRQKCILDNGRPTVPQNTTLFPIGEDYNVNVPRLTLMSSTWSADAVSPIDKPGCTSLDTPGTPLQALPSSHGWQPEAIPHTKTHGYRASEPGAQIDFEVDLVQGYVQVSYQKSQRHGMGWVSCWFDEGDWRHGRKLDGWWNNKAVQPTFTEINAKPIAPGKHTLHCRLLEKNGKEEGRGTNFMIVSIMTL